MSIITNEITGYKWDSIEEFNTDLSTVNDALILPMGDDDITAVVMETNTNLEGEVVLFYYVGKHDQLTPVLGAPTTFDINVEVPDE